MSIVLTIIIAIAMFAAFAYTLLVTVGYDNFSGITLELDNMYNNTREIADAVVNQLEKEGKQCEILEVGNGYPKLLVDGKKYILTFKMASMVGFPTQVVQLKRCKE